MDFVLFLLVNAVLYLRPAEIIPDLANWPIYEVLILACLAVSCFSVARQLRPRSLVQQPITACVLALLPAIVLSGLPRFWFTGAMLAGADFGKVVVYYLLFIATVNSVARLRLFLLTFTGLILVLAGVALLQYHGWINLPALATLQQRVIDNNSGEITFLLRLQSTGIYNDPNDLSQILAVGLILCLYWLTEKKFRLFRFAWALPLCVLAYAIVLTQSRGGFLALLAGLFVLCVARLGWRKGLLMAVAAVPVVLLVFAGRQTSINLSDREDTAQARLELWSEGLLLFRQAPLFGIGYGNYADEVGLVAHNSYLHAYTELGILGGSLFVGSFYIAIASLSRLRKASSPLLDAGLGRLHPYMLAVLASYMVAMWSLTRCYTTPTYTVLALAAVYARLALPTSGLLPLRLNAPLCKRLALANVLALAGIYVFVRLLIQHG